MAAVLFVAALVALALMVAVRGRVVGEGGVPLGGGAAGGGHGGDVGAAGRVLPVRVAILPASSTAGPAVPVMGVPSTWVMAGVSAWAGAAMATTVAPRPARPKVRRAAAVAMRVVIM